MSDYQVNPITVNGIAEEMKAAGAKLQKEIDTLKSLRTELNTKWEGPASLAYDQVFDADIRLLEEYYDLPETVEGYRRRWQGHGREICQVSLPQALVCFFEGDNYEDVIRNCVSIGGDTDTIAAIAGGIAEAYYGVPEDMKTKVRSFLDSRLLRITDSFADWLKERETV